LLGINRIIVLFICLVVLIFTGVWQTIQSESFASLMSNKISRVISRKLDIELKFKKFRLELFPPSTVFQEVSVKRKSSNELIILKARKFGVIFSLSNLFSSDLSIERIEVVDGDLKYLDYSKTKSEQFDLENWVKNFNIRKYFIKYKKDVVEEIPIRLNTLVFKNIYGQINSDDIFLERMRLDVYENVLKLGFNIEDVNIANANFKVTPNSFKLESELSENKFRIIELELLDEINKFNFSGELFNIDGALNVQGTASFIGDLKTVKDNIKSLNDITLEGLGEIQTTFTGSVLDPDLDIDVNVKNLKSDYAQVENVSIKGRKISSILKLDKLLINEKDSSLNLEKPLDLYDLNKKLLLNKEAELKVTNLHTNTVLYIIKDSLDSFKGNITGTINTSWNKSGELNFNITENTILENFRLTGPKNNILNTINKINIGNSLVYLDKKGAVYIDADLSFKNSHLIASGFIKGSNISFETRDSYLDFDEFGPISGTQLHGVGEFNFKIIGDDKDVKFLFDLNMKKFSVLDYNLGNVNGRLELSLESLDLKVREFNGSFGETEYDLGGLLNFGSNSSISLDANIKKTNYADSIKMYNSILGPIKNLPKEELNFIYNADYKIQGNFEKDGVSVSGQLNARNIKYEIEDIDSFKTKFTYEKSKLVLEHVIARKSSGFIEGSFLYDIKNEYIKYNGSMSRIKLKDIELYRILNLGYDGDLNADLTGEGKIDSFNSKTKIVITNAKIKNMQVEDSRLSIHNQGKNIYLNSNLLNNKVVLDSFINLDKSSSKKSELKIISKIPDLKLVLGLLSAHNIDDDSIEGNLDFTLESKFSIYNIERLSTHLLINSFYLKKGLASIKSPANGNIIIENGTIKDWDIIFDNGSTYIKSVGEGKFYKDLKIQNFYQLNANLAEIITPSIQRMSGDIDGRAILFRNNSKYKFQMETFGKNIFAKIKDIPGNFSDINFKAVAVDNNIILESMKGKFGKGDFSSSGSINVKLPLPHFNISTLVKNSQIKLLNKSSMVVSGSGSLTGSSMPYKFTGRYSIDHGEVLEEFSEFSRKSANTFVEERFIPKVKFRTNTDVLHLDLAINTSRPILFKNSMSELYTQGNVSITGSPENLKFLGSLSVVPITSSFRFKGNQFIVSQGSIAFSDFNRKNITEYSFSANSQTNDFNIGLDVSGRNDKFTLNLSSDPYLSEDDIFSLLTLGLTSDMSKELGDKDLQSVTSVGIGSLLADQFKINEGLNSSLGLNLSVLPEFQSEDTSLLEGRNSSSDASTQRLRSATKIKIRKKVNETVDLAVSSTFGGSVEQKQEMNLDINIHRNVSVQGVYEVKTSEDENLSKRSNSVGADVKFRFSF
jgi:translocation and assembly module TamB